MCNKYTRRIAPSIIVKNYYSPHQMFPFWNRYNTYLCPMKKLLFLLLLFISVLAVHDAAAQGCAMCASTAGSLNENSAKGLNNGIIYLASIPLLFISVTGIYWYRRSKQAEVDI